ncbi:glycoside hydrolase family 71/99 protein [Mucisphaera calidilacus]|uniref:Uncharacterized protein n=1 Tax=Mucisphaera calidilacus TaxID=2527982 RepID=A0A518BUF4_9BACT|nr:hypothetical protein [Mucisphaera calidilacus]QDU70567.1 hypothetical protein Pan265_03950 [Mucisphaera calidilacus]
MRLRILTLVLLVNVVCGGVVWAQADRESTPGKRLLMHYMPWYTTPEVREAWGGHWTGWGRHDPEDVDASGRRDVWSHYYPLIGTYDSADPDVIECQLLQMKLAGVDGVIVDWYGISDLYDYPDNHVGSQALFTVAARVGMTFAVCFEDRTVQSLVEQERLDEGDVAEHLTAMVRWLDLHWFRHAHYERVDGRPLLLNFGPIYVKDASAWEAALGSVAVRPVFFALHHLWRGVEGDGGFTWVHADAWEDSAGAEDVKRKLHQLFDYVSGGDPERVIVSAVPGFKDVYDRPMIELDHREGATLEASLAACMDGPWRIVQLVTWNDYGEGTVIEPTREFGYRFLEIIQAARREEAGIAFSFTAEDLRLPARLLELRRSGDVDRGALDAVADMISDGRCDEARRAMDRLER